MSWATSTPPRWSSMVDGKDCVDGKMHNCEFPRDHSDHEYDGYHQCKCGQAW